MLNETEYHIVLNKQQVNAISHGIIAMEQTITIKDRKYELIVVGKNQYRKMQGMIKDG